MKKPEDYGSIMGINEEQYNELIKKIELVQGESYQQAIDDYKASMKPNIQFVRNLKLNEEL